MRLSELKGNSITKKLQFINGEVTLVEVANGINGEINFFDLTAERLTKINEEIISKTSDKLNDEQFMFALIPYVCDVEADITCDEFLSLLKSPTKGFAEFVNAIMVCLKELFGVLESISKAEQSADALVEDISNVATENNTAQQEVNAVSEIQEEDIDNQLDKLYEKLSQTTNREERNKIIKRITMLER